MLRSVLSSGLNISAWAYGSVAVWRCCIALPSHCCSPALPCCWVWRTLPIFMRPPSSACVLRCTVFLRHGLLTDCLSPASRPASSRASLRREGVPPQQNNTTPGFSCAICPQRNMRTHAHGGCRAPRRGCGVCGLLRRTGSCHCSPFEGDGSDLDRGLKRPKAHPRINFFSIPSTASLPLFHFLTELPPVIFLQASHTTIGGCQGGEGGPRRLDGSLQWLAPPPGFPNIPLLTFSPGEEHLL